MNRTGTLYRVVTIGFDENDEPIKASVGFSFTMNFWNEFCRREKIKMSEIGTVMNQGNPRIWEVYQNILYCAALAYAEPRDIPFTLNEKLAGEWITDMEQGEFNELVHEMTQTRIFGKNIGGLRANKDQENPTEAA